MILPEVILAGRPNSGKSTLFNRMASAHQRVGNYAGCTVEKKSSVISREGEDLFDLTDLPGVYSLKANSLDEEVALRHLQEQKEKSTVVFVLDGNNLQQELILPLMLKKQGYRVVIAVNMMDEVRANKRILDLAGMQDLAEIPFFPVSAKTGEGVETLKRYLIQHIRDKKEVVSSQEESSLALYQRAKQQASELNRLNKGKENGLLERDLKIDRYLLHPILGPVIFFVTMFVLFQSIFTWAAPLSDSVESLLGGVQNLVKANVSSEMLASLLSDGVLAGVGAVLVFVPQIAILFFLIGLLEYSGYLPRTAYMVDRLLKPYGLNGKVFIPLLSSVACAVPGIMSTRTIESQRTRLITIMISPLMTCSARLPVYALLISTFIPNRMLGPFQLQGLVMFAMYALGAVVALLVALVLHWLDFGSRKHLVDFIHLPHYRMPNWPELFRYVWSRVYAFLRKAGTIIAVMAILLWALLSFPLNHENHQQLMQSIEAVQSSPASDLEKEVRISELESAHASIHLEQSYGGRLGKFLEPVFLPIGYDWRLTIGVLSSLAAREVFVSTIGTVFSLGDVEDDTTSLSETLKNSKSPDGSPAYGLGTCLSLLLFFAFSLQCVSTLGVARRESNSWKIPAFMWLYMFILAYVSAFIAYRIGNFIG